MCSLLLSRTCLGTQSYNCKVYNGLACTTYQCSRIACRNADSPSITIRIATVNTVNEKTDLNLLDKCHLPAHTAKLKNKYNEFRMMLNELASKLKGCKIISHNTSDNSIIKFDCTMYTCALAILLTSMSQTKGPQSQIGGSVGNTTQTILYSMNCLLCHCFSHVKLKSHNSWRETKKYHLWAYFFWLCCWIFIIP